LPPSLTAEEGAHQRNWPVFEKLYKSVRDGTETRNALEFNGSSTYREDLARELKDVDNKEIWRAGKTVHSLRPDYEPS
jgi:ketol-acid reductoisomerase